MESWIPLLVGFGGAAVGAAASIGGVLAQSWFQNRRERMSVAVQAAIEDQKRIMRLASISSEPTPIYPLSMFIMYHAKVLKLIERNALTQAKFHELDALFLSFSKRHEGEQTAKGMEA